MKLRHDALPASFFTKNRKAFLNQLNKHSIVLFFSADWSIRNADQKFPWRQDSNFFYFTGIESPECFLLLLPENTGMPEEILFIPPIDPELEKWEGEMLTIEKAKELSGIEIVMSTSVFQTVFYRAQQWREFLYCDVNECFSDQALTKQHLFLREIRDRLPGIQFKKSTPLLVELRMHKKPEEIEQIKTSLNIIEKALAAAARRIQPGVFEYQLEAELTFQYLNHGCIRHGFEPIVASGKNAVTLHYHANSDAMRQDEGVLIDTGGQYGMYTGDITRVYPVNGTFSGELKQFYELNLEIQEECLKILKPGLTMSQIDSLCSEIQGKILFREKMIADPNKHKHLTLHRIGHLLGLDTHDLCHPNIPLQEGAVLTIEPGLYLPEKNIGIRIEENIVLTKTGFENLSRNIAKKPNAIENLMANSNNSLSK